MEKGLKYMPHKGPGDVYPGEGKTQERHDHCCLQDYHVDGLDLCSLTSKYRTRHKPWKLARGSSVFGKKIPENLNFQKWNELCAPRHWRSSNKAK